MRKFQEAGKNLLLIVRPEQINTLMENLPSRGLFLVTTAPTREDADTILKNVSRLTHE